MTAELERCIYGLGMVVHLLRLDNMRSRQKNARPSSSAGRGVLGEQSPKTFAGCHDPGSAEF